VEIVPFVAEHLDGVIRLCVAEGWPSFTEDPERAIRVLTAPGVTTVIAMDGGQVVGFAELLSDGELQAFLANLAVDERFRGRGTGRALVVGALRVAGGERIDCSAKTGPRDSMGASPTSRSRGFACTHSTIRARVRRMRAKADGAALTPRCGHTGSFDPLGARRKGFR
jgi:GNAT superfamily N-acetyltransferase